MAIGTAGVAMARPGSLVLKTDDNLARNCHGSSCCSHVPDRAPDTLGLGENMTVTDDDLDARLRAFRLPDSALPPQAMAMLARETRERARRRSVRAAAVWGAATAALAVGAVTAGPAVAHSVQTFLAQSGWTSWGTEVVEGSEFIDTSAPDLAEYVDTIYPADLPLAPGQTREGVISTVVSLQSPGLRQEVGLRRDIERQIRLGWLEEWIDAYQVVDSGRMASAATVLLDSATWPAFVATDGGGVVAVDKAFMTAVADGDAEMAQAFAQYDDAPFWDGVDRTVTIDRVIAGAGVGE